MYIPKCFEITDNAEIFSFIEANAFGQIISNVSGRPFSTHLPFLVSDDKLKLIGHLARHNPQCEQLSGQEVLVTLEGAHGYISPSWYEGQGVPTWNYQAVHVYGSCIIFQDKERLQKNLDTLTKKYESVFENPWEAKYNPAMLNAIIGIEITINEIQCKYKLSQNKSDMDRALVMAKLKETGSYKVSANPTTSLHSRVVNPLHPQHFARWGAS